MTILLVALGGALGSVLRFLGVTALGAPWGTAAVNVVGSFAMGALYVLLSTRTAVSPFFLTGVLGGFTTFSAFSLDALKLWEGGEALQAGLYVAVSVILSLVAVAAGLALGRALA